MLQLTATGNIGQNAKTQNINGKQVIQFSIASNAKTSQKDKNGNPISETTWLSCSYWTESEKIANYLTQGTGVLVQGKPTVRQYQSKNEGLKIDFSLIVEKIEFLSKSEKQKETVNTETGEILEENLAF
jgi:single stranded DNA-binding protein